MEPMEPIVKSLTDFESKIDIKDIVTRIDYRDIKRYVERKHYMELDTIDTRNKIAYEINELDILLQNQGYIIDRVYCIETKDEQIYELKKEIKKLRHEVSILAKRLNKCANT